MLSTAQIVYVRSPLCLLRGQLWNVDKVFEAICSQDVAREGRELLGIRYVLLTKERSWLILFFMVLIIIVYHGLQCTEYMKLTYLNSVFLSLFCPEYMRLTIIVYL